MTDTFYATTPIYYPNGAPHIGSTYTTSYADTLVRYHRAAGERTFLLTGTDEHGEKMAQCAAEEGLEPRALVDRTAPGFRRTWDELGLNYDRFIRTTELEHVHAVQHFWQKIYDSGEVEFTEYTGRYCVGCESYLTDREIVAGKCPSHQTEPELRSESNYFFKITHYYDWLVDTLQARPELITPDRYRNEVISLVKSGALGDLCITRPRERLSWGIQAPWDADYTIYVWNDALVNYLTGIGYPDGDWEELWSGAHHLIGKDILKQHAIFWPIMLHVGGFPLYQGLHVHGMWNMDEEKISKSLGNLVDPLVMKQKYGFEGFRYYLLREMSYGLDSEFSEEAVVARINADLANDLGNLLNRSISMLERYFDGVVPEHEGESELRGLAETAAAEVDRHVRAFSTQRALAALWELVAGANRYIEAQAPWVLARDPEQRGALATVMGELLEAIRVIAVLLECFLPEASARMLESLGSPPHDGTLAERTRWGRLEPGARSVRIDALFPRIETA